MTTRIYIDRSRIVTRERCDRRRWLEYHESGTGIRPAKTPLPLAVGSAVHAGLAVLLRDTQALLNVTGIEDSAWPPVAIEERAVTEALREFSAHREALELDAGEVAAMQPTAAAELFQSQVAAQATELGMDASAVAGLARDPAVARSEFDRYLFAEQSALVEAMVRAYARRRLQPLLSQFEVLEVEREGEWLLSDWWVNYSDSPNRDDGSTNDKRELWFMSRPDALLRERATNELYLLSYKTTATWDVRKARDIEHDMQGLSEGVEVERRLGEWWAQVHAPGSYRDALGFNIPTPMYIFLKNLPAAPRIHAIRYEFLLKGYRSEDRELSARLGVTAYTQHSHLVRQYVATSTPKKGDGGYRVGDVCWSWEYYRPEDDKDSKLAWQNWKAQPVWECFQGFNAEHPPVRRWIDRLDRSELLMSGADSTVGLEPRALGYRSDAQTMGVTREHPLEQVFVPAATVWRSDDDLRDWVESVEAAERKVAEGVASVQAATDAGERRSLMNVHFPMVRSSCEYPSQCAFVKVCYAGAEMKNDPLAVGGGIFVRRVANHPQELVQVTKPIP